MDKRHDDADDHGSHALAEVSQRGGGQTHGLSSSVVHLLARHRACGDQVTCLAAPPRSVSSTITYRPDCLDPHAYLRYSFLDDRRSSGASRRASPAYQPSTGHKSITGLALSTRTVTSSTRPRVGRSEHELGDGLQRLRLWRAEDERRHRRLARPRRSAIRSFGPTRQTASTSSSGTAAIASRCLPAR